jgi:hypothetical protein
VFHRGDEISNAAFFGFGLVRHVRLPYPRRMLAGD